MFPAILCSCSPLSTGALHGRLQRVTIPDAVTYNLTSWGWALCCSKHVEDYNVIYIYHCKIKKLCIKLVIEASLYCDARSEKHQIHVTGFEATYVVCGMGRVNKFSYIQDLSNSEGWNKGSAYKNTFLLNDILLVDIAMVEVSEACH